MIRAQGRTREKREKEENNLTGTKQDTWLPHCLFLLHFTHSFNSKCFGEECPVFNVLLEEGKRAIEREKKSCRKTKKVTAEKRK